MTPRCSRWLLCVAAGLSAAGALRADNALVDVAQVVKLEAHPPSLRLQGKDWRQQLLLTAKLAGGKLRDATRQAIYRSADPKIATVSATGLIEPIGSGQTQVEATLGNQRIEIAVDVKDGARFQPLDFPTDILPILTKASCNSGGCHGKSGGRGGLQLSLFGYNPRNDFEAIVHGSRGRRLLPSSPEHSLLVRKPTGAVPHGGGKRLPADSMETARVLRWIAQGTPWGSDNPPALQRLEITPASRALGYRADQQITVTALYADGRQRDVTRLTTFHSNDPAVAIVDDDGLVTTGERVGATAIVCKYQGQVGVANILVPLEKKDVARWPDLPRGNFIDDLVMAKLHELNVPPSPLVDDAGFLRRVTLQIAGRLPTVAEARAFLADPRLDKRVQLVDRLLESGDYADLFAQKWASVLRNKLRSQRTRVAGTVGFHRWIRNALAENMPYDRFVREIITATGSPTVNPPAQWYAEVRYLDRYVDDTAQVFLGLRIGCARCHNHPFEKFTQDDYFGLAAFFARVDRKGGLGLKTERAADETIFVKPIGTVKHPVTDRVVQPHGLGRPGLEIPAYDDPRAYLVDWLGQPDNPYFARAFVNRMWAHFFGRGLVEPLDDQRATNPASNDPLLTALAEEFIKSRFNMRHIVRLIATSTTYQLSSTPNADNLNETQAHARFYPQRLTAEVLYDAINDVTRTKPGRFTDMPDGTRAVQLPHEEFNDVLLELFGRPRRESACECEREATPNMGQSVYLMNNPAFLSKVKSGLASQLAKDTRAPEEKVRELFLAALSRLPQPAELALALEHLRQEGSTPSAYSDLIWVVLNMKEFLYVL